MRATARGIGTIGIGESGVEQELQQIIDHWAEKLGRSIVLDSMDLRGIASSRHFGDADEARIQTLLGGGRNEVTAEYLRANGAADGDRPRWIAGRPDLGLESRLYVPIRCNGVALGVLCLIDRERDLESRLPELQRVADRIGVLLYAQSLRHERERNREEALLRELFSSDARARQEAMREIEEEELLRRCARTVVITAHWPETEPDRDSEALGLRLRRELSHEAARSALWMRGRRSLTFLLGDDGRGEESAALAEARATSERLLRESDDLGAHCGISEPMRGLAEARADGVQAGPPRRARGRGAARFRAVRALGGSRRLRRAAQTAVGRTG